MIECKEIISTTYRHKHNKLSREFKSVKNRASEYMEKIIDNSNGNNAYFVHFYDIDGNHIERIRMPKNQRKRYLKNVGEENLVERKLPNSSIPRYSKHIPLKAWNTTHSVPVNSNLSTMRVGSYPYEMGF